MKNWLLYFFAVLVMTAAVPFAAKSTSLAKEIPVITVSGDDLVLEMSIEEYVLRALTAEGKSAESFEAKKALAVALRSEAFYLSAFGLKHEDFDVCKDPNCCLELGNIEGDEKEFLAECIAAVEETSGVVLTDEGDPAMALFCVCSGSGTSDCEEFPYLSAVSESERCEKHKTELSFSKEQLENFGISPSAENSCIIYDNSEKCALAVFGGSVFDGGSLERLLGLPSREFYFEFDGDNLKTINYGVGNGFGLNLCGAERLSEKGKTFGEILEIYYPNLELKQIYD